ncbi:hypothetical protein MTO96_003610 [Rhipicephalus appendiculatus]
MMKNTIAKLMAEIAEIRRGRGELSSSADKQMAESVPTEIPVAADCDAERPAKKRAIAGEQEKMASRAKTEIREMLSSLSESMKQLSETVSHLQCSMLAMEERQESWDDEVLRTLVTKYLQVASSPADDPPLKEYEGVDNPELDAEFGVEEV